MAGADCAGLRFRRIHKISPRAPALIVAWRGNGSVGLAARCEAWAVFGIIRPCRHRLGGELGVAWQAHLCGVCLSLREDYGQAARLATNYDGLVISVLVEAQAGGLPGRRAAGRCALRRMRKADVAVGDCARLAATVSLVLAAAKLRDHTAVSDMER